MGEGLDLVALVVGGGAGFDGPGGGGGARFDGPGGGGRG